MVFLKRIKEYIVEHIDRIKAKLTRLFQRITRGWDDSDTWSLDYTIAKFALPRLKRFQELNNGWPDKDFMTFEKWNEAIDKMIWSFEQICNNFDGLDMWDDTISKEDNYKKIKEFDDKVQEGLNLFGKYFRALWW